MEMGDIKNRLEEIMPGLVSKYETMKLRVENEEKEQEGDEDEEVGSDTEEKEQEGDEDEELGNDTEETEQEEGGVASDQEVLTEMLSDIKDSLISGVNLADVQDELSYVKSQLKEMLPSEAVTKMDQVVALMGKALEQKLVALEQDKEEVESFEGEEEQGNGLSSLDVLTGMLSDIRDSLISSVELGSLQSELNFVQSQLEEMEPSEAVTKMNQVAILLGNALEQKTAALEQEKEEVVSFEEEAGEVPMKDLSRAEDVASVMSKLGFPEAKIDEVKSILNVELEAYDVNSEEKDELKEDESEY
jgi:hypothetical protein